MMSPGAVVYTAIPVSGTGFPLAVWVILGCWAIALLVIGLLGALGGDDSDDNGPGSGGDGPESPRPPEDNPRSGEPQWWPEFERQFADYLRHQPSRAVPGSSRSAATGLWRSPSGSIRVVTGHELAAWKSQHLVTRAHNAQYEHPDIGTKSRTNRRLYEAT
jgi:hypothetical protein